VGGQTLMRLFADNIGWLQGMQLGPSGCVGKLGTPPPAQARAQGRAVVGPLRWPPPPAPGTLRGREGAVPAPDQTAEMMGPGQMALRGMHQMAE